MAKYTLNELTDMHLLYGDTEVACTQLIHHRWLVCTMHYNKWKPLCSTNVNTFQHCTYAVAQEWIVNANVLTVLIVASLR